MNETRYFKSIQPFSVSIPNIEIICAEWNENFELYDLNDKYYLRPDGYRKAFEISLSDACELMRRLNLVADFSEGKFIYHRKRQDIF